MNFTVPYLGELFGPSDSELLLTLIWILPLFIFVLYGQRIQLAVTSREIKKSIEKLHLMQNESRQQLVKYAKSISSKCNQKDIAMLADYFTVFPIDLDPAGCGSKDSAYSALKRRCNTCKNHDRLT